MLYFILGLVALILIVAIFVKKDIAAERQIVINKPKQQVFEYIKSLKNQNTYSKWGTLDSAMKINYTGTDGTVGFISAWDGNSKVGKGEQEIKKITEGERIDFELRFEKPLKSTSDAYMTTTAVTDSSTKVAWGFKGKMNYPLNIFNLFMDANKTIGEDFAVGLSRLKNSLEK